MPSTPDASSSCRMRCAGGPGLAPRTKRTRNAGPAHVHKRDGLRLLAVVLDGARRKHLQQVMQGLVAVQPGLRGVAGSCSKPGRLAESTHRVVPRRRGSPHASSAPQTTSYPAATDGSTPVSSLSSAASAVAGGAGAPVLGATAVGDCNASSSAALWRRSSAILARFGSCAKALTAASMAASPIWPTLNEA